MRNGTPYKLDLEILRPDGTRRWISDRGEALSDASGRITALRGTAQDITERKQAEEALRESEERFRTMFRNAGVGMVIVSPAGRFLAANNAFCDYLGYTEEELLQKTVQSITLTEDWPELLRKLTETLEHGTTLQRIEKRCLHKSGRVLTTESSASWIRGTSDEPLYLIGTALDVTERRHAEEALAGVSSRLIEAHEEERTWIARELHDDISQQIAMLAVDLEDLKRKLPPSAGMVSQGLADVGHQVSSLGSDVQALSHRLHSSKLEYLGIAAAAAGFCKELSEKQGVEINFHSEGLPKNLSQDISLCLFRVLQEALQNAVKHSGSQHLEVSLLVALNAIQLIVRDSGIGFDFNEAMKGRGVGLSSMRERLKLVGGKFSIESQLQQGTTIHARVPLSCKMKSAGAGE
jgi:PAS domain S-box-containing protein